MEQLKQKFKKEVDDWYDEKTMTEDDKKDKAEVFKLLDDLHEP